MYNLQIGCLNASQDRLIKAFEAVYEATQEKKKADAHQWELRNDPEALVAFQAEWSKAFNKRTITRQEAHELVRKYPSSAADLLERMFVRLMEAQDAKK